MHESGKYYAFSAISAFQSFANEIRIGGHAAANRIIPLTNQSLLSALVTAAEAYLELPLFPGTALPDWGAGATHFLECQNTYQHGVAALQVTFDKLLPVSLLASLT